MNPRTRDLVQATHQLAQSAQGCCLGCGCALPLLFVLGVLAYGALKALVGWP